jgi:hypothetical protein
MEQSLTLLVISITLALFGLHSFRSTETLPLFLMILSLFFSESGHGHIRIGAVQADDSNTRPETRYYPFPCNSEQIVSGIDG